MNDIVAMLFVLLPTMALVPVIGRMGGREAPMIIGALALQVLAAVIHVVIVREYYGYGDMLGYWRSGVRLAQGVEGGFIGLDDIIAVVLQLDNPLVITGNGRTTGSMHGIACLLCLGLDDSLYAICTLIAVAGFVGRLWMFAALRIVWPTASRQLAIAVFFLPSTIFWSAALLKEGVAMPGLALATGALIRMLHDRRPSAAMIALMGVGIVVVGLTKPYLLVPLALSAAVGAFVRSASTLSSVPVAVLVAVGLVGLGVLFPRYALGAVVESAEELRSLGVSHAGSSTFSLPAGGLPLLLPLGVATALFRPLFFEVRSALLLLSAIEMAVVAWFVLGAVRAPRRAWRGIRQSWLLASSVTFVLVFSVALGLSTTNLGTLARYRAPMMSHYGVVLVGLAAMAQRRRLPLQAGAPREYSLKVVGRES